MFRKISHIQLPQGVVEDNKARIKLNIPRNYKTGGYFEKLPHLKDVNDPAFQNSVVDAVNNSDKLCIFLLAMSDFTRKNQENLNAIITDGGLDDAVV